MVLFLMMSSISRLIFVIRSGLQLLFPDLSALTELSESVKITTFSGLFVRIHFSASMMAVNSALKIDALLFSLKLLQSYNRVKQRLPLLGLYSYPYCHLCIFEGKIYSWFGCEV